MRRLGPQTEEKPFNNSIGKLMRIDDLWRAADNFKIEEDTERYYNVLECLYRTCKPHFQPDENEVLKKQIIVIEHFLDASKMTGGNVAASNVRKGSNLCDTLAEQLSVLLHKYNLEWFDSKDYKAFMRSKEPIMRG